MAEHIEFVKMSGCGNDFVMVDAVRAPLSGDLSELARKVCARRTGVGADGLVILERGQGDSFRVRIFNSDGSEAEMCGNAMRCVARFARMKGHAGDEITVETLAGLLRARIVGDDAQVQMTPPAGAEIEFPVEVDGVRRVVSFINTGVPHAVVFVEDVSRVNVEKVGRALRFHPRFAPAGTNVDFAQVLGPAHLAMRTYERGVEGETLACGTGATAAAALARLIGRVTENTVRVDVPGGSLLIGLEFTGSELTGATLAGEARVVYRGVTEQLTPGSGCPAAQAKVGADKSPTHQACRAKTR